MLQDWGLIIWNPQICSSFKQLPSWYKTEETVQLYRFILTKEHCTKIHTPCRLLQEIYVPSFDTIFYAHMIRGHPVGPLPGPFMKRDRSRQVWAWDLTVAVLVSNNLVSSLSNSALYSFTFKELHFSRYDFILFNFYVRTIPSKYIYFVSI